MKKTSTVRLSHIGIAVADIEKAIGSWAELFGDDQPHRERVDDQGVDIASFAVGDILVELTGATAEDTPIGRFLAKRGEGIHHVAFEVDDIDAELSRLREAGVRLIDEKPRMGGHGMRIAFLHPQSFHGVLVEICSPSE